MGETTTQGALTNLSYYLVVLQHAPSYIDAIIVPVCPWHLLVDICVDTRHLVVALLGASKGQEGLFWVGRC